MTAVAVAVAAGLGTLVRAGVSRWLDRRRPLGTLVVNVAGSFAAGWLVAADAEAFTVVGTGALGALTTFSAVAVAAIERPESAGERALVTAALIGLPIGAAWCGLAWG